MIKKKYFKPFKQQNCYDLSKVIFEDYGIKLPEYKKVLFELSKFKEIDELARTYLSNDYIKIDKPVIPCIVVFNDVLIDGQKICKHFGVYIDDGVIIHTTRKTNTATIPIDHPWWSKKIEGFYVPR